MLVLVNTPLDSEDRAIVEKSWPAACELVVRGEVSSEEIDARAAEFDAVIGRLNSGFLREATRVRLIHVLGHGVDWLEKGELAQLIDERGIALARANHASISIAEYVIGSMIMLARQLMSVHHALAMHGDWRKAVAHTDRGRAEFGSELYGATVVIAGLGDVGQTVAERAAALGMHTIGLTRDPAKHPAVGGALEVVAPLAEADAWLGRADHTVLALPLAPQTRQFFDRSRIEAMKPGGYLINICRGDVMDYDALVDALASGHIAGAALDVWPAEDPRKYPISRPIHQYNVIMTPHCAAATPASRSRALETIGDNLHRWLAGTPLRNQVR